jgi:hypothetical protein
MCIAKNKMILTGIIYAIIEQEEKSANNIGMERSVKYIAKTKMILTGIIYVIM